jgi:hypothetical protein
LVSVSEDVYRRLSKLAVERNKTISDLIEELLDSYEGRVGNDVVGRLGRIEVMLRDCLDKLGVRETKPIEAKSGQAETMPTESKGEVGGDSVFGDNPWIQVLRVKYSRGS